MREQCRAFRFCGIAELGVSTVYETLATLTASTAEYDLLSTLTQYLDPHMVFPLINYLNDLKVRSPLHSVFVVLAKESLAPSSSRCAVCARVTVELGA